MNESTEIKQLRTLFKYVSDSPKVINGIFQDNKIRFTQPAALNDPLEFNPAIRFSSEDGNFNTFKYKGVNFPSIHDWHQLNIIEKRINRYGVLSLCDNPFSFEMWTHYSNGHRGLLLEFDIADKARPFLKLNNGLNLKVHKVRYVKDYSINIDKLTAGKISIPFYKIRDAIFLKKTKHWKYEREYRIIRQLDECDYYKPPTKRTSYRDTKNYLFPLSLKCISAVIFGVNTSQEIKKKVINLCRKTKIAFLQTIIYKDQQNKIEFIPIDTFGSISQYLAMKPQLFTFDSIKIKYKDSLHINKLQELPYYHLQKDDWDLYYEKKSMKEIR